MDIRIDRDSAVPVYLQIRGGIRDLILSGRLPDGFRLPPERQLATALGVNRTTMLSAYRELKADGLVEAHVGRGTEVVSQKAGQERRRAGRAAPLAAARAGRERPRARPARARPPRPHRAARRHQPLGRPPRRRAPPARRPPARPGGDPRPEGARGPPPQPDRRGHGVSRGALPAHGPARHPLEPGGGPRHLGLAAGARPRRADAPLPRGRRRRRGAVLLRRARGRSAPPASASSASRPTRRGCGPTSSRRSSRASGPRLIYTLPTFQNPSGCVLSLPRRRHLLELA